MRSMDIAHSIMHLANKTADCDGAAMNRNSADASETFGSAAADFSHATSGLRSPQVDTDAPWAAGSVDADNAVLASPITFAAWLAEGEGTCIETTFAPWSCTNRLQF